MQPRARPCVLLSCCKMEIRFTLLSLAVPALQAVAGNSSTALEGFALYHCTINK